ncbi:MAG: hypothetical protein J6Z40_09850, partial [Oscillospiraceae bacterium]|nr:hypothetical protein [Oscillospiraceae bacterium]
HGRNQQANLSAATGIESEIEDVSSAADTEVLPCYVSRMQEYYAAKTGTPCDFDFTGWGKDFDDVSLENENWRVELKAVTGCDWVLYYFYDVTPLQGQTKDDFQSEFPGITFTAGNDTISSGVTSPYKETDDSDNGVWHCCGILCNYSTVPFSAEDTKLSYYYVNMNENDPNEFFDLDFTPQSVPLYDRESDLSFTYDVNRMCPDSTHFNPPQYEKDLGEIPLRRTAISPFGMYCVSDSFEADTPDFEGTFYPLQEGETRLGFEDTIVQVDDNNAAVDKYCAGRDTYFGTFDFGENSIAFIHILYDHPMDTAKGELRYPYEAFYETPETEPTTDPQEESGTNDSVPTEPRPGYYDAPRIVYAATDLNTGEPFDTLADAYSDAAPEHQAQYDQIAVYSKHSKLLLDGKALKGINEEITPDENNMLNFTFEWTPDTNLAKQDISIEIRPELARAADGEALAYGKSNEENIVMIEPVEYGPYQDPETGEWLPSNFPEAVAAFTLEPSAENCITLRYTMQIDLNKINLDNSRQISILVDYRSGDNAGNKKDVVFRQEYILMIKK